MSLDPLSVPFLHSCERCRQKKRKCSGEKPACEWCRNHNVPCRYRRSMRFKRQLEAQASSSSNSLVSPIEQTMSLSGIPQISSTLNSIYNPVAMAGQSVLASSNAVRGSGNTNITPNTSIQNDATIPIFQSTSSQINPVSLGGPFSGSRPISMPKSRTNSISNHVQSNYAAGGVTDPATSGQVPDSTTADALSNLLSADMSLMTNPLPPHLIQYLNSFISPLQGTVPQSIPSWLSPSNPEASILANLGDLANPATMSSESMAPLTLNDHTSYGSISDSVMCDFFDHDIVIPSSASSMLTDQSPAEDSFDRLFGNSNTGLISPDPMVSGPSLPSFVSASVPSTQLSSTGINIANGGIASSSPTLIAPPSAGVQQSVVYSNAMKQPGITVSQKHISESIYNNTPSFDIAKDKLNVNQSPILPIKEEYTNRETSSGVQGNSVSWKNTDRKTQAASALSISKTSPNMEGECTFTSDSVEIPNLLKIYTQQLPHNTSAETIYKIMLGTFKAPRMGLVSLNLELIWYMMHKGILPRIAFYGHISSTIRFNAANLDLKTALPPNIDEACYELALKEVPIAYKDATLWGAIGLCMITRYEFQSSRYAEMRDHTGMAFDILHRIKYKGHSYPWLDVGNAEKETFSYQYLLVIFWKCFLWKIICAILIDDSIDFELSNLPDFSSLTYNIYSLSNKYNVDLMEIIPPGSWTETRDVISQSVIFRGSSDPNFACLRPKDSPCFDRVPVSGKYMQHMLVIFSKYLGYKGKISQNKIELTEYLKGTWIFQEQMRTWRCSIPQRLIPNNEKIQKYLKMIKPTSSASLKEIDRMASWLKDTIMLFCMYNMFLLRTSRLTMKLILGENVSSPLSDISTKAFGIRDLYDVAGLPQIVSDNLGYMNYYFHNCRFHAFKAGNSLCDLIQAAYLCRFNLYTLGTPIIPMVFDLLVVHTSLLKTRDKKIQWRAKSRLSNIFNILRMLRHWAPALHTFVAGLKALSDPSFCLEEPVDQNMLNKVVVDPSMLAMTGSPISSSQPVSDSENDDKGLTKKRRFNSELSNPRKAGALISNSATAIDRDNDSPELNETKRDETRNYHAPDPIPEFPNPFQPNHVMSLIIKDLKMSLAEFLAPAYPILLLKVIPTRHYSTSEGLLIDK